MKRPIIITIVLLGIIGSSTLAQSKIFSFVEKESMITEAQPKDALLKNLDGEAIKFENEHNDLVPDYDLEVDAAVMNAEMTEQAQKTVAKTQTIKQRVSVQSTSSMITKAQAIAIAQQKATGIVIKAKFNQDDNEYEIEIVKGKIEYKFKVDATTGGIVYFREGVDD